VLAINVTFTLLLQITVQRSRLRESIFRISGPLSQSQPIHRRIYSVGGPNALWHLDGNHKLIRWKIVIHGGVDGYSRLITYLKCSNNNCSETVLNNFVQATQMFGIPSRVRTDYGGKNVKVWDFMEQQRGSGRNSYIAGRSVHNTRIERLWRDVYRSVSSSFVAVFNELEDIGALNPDNDADMFCLHYIFIPQINLSLLAFQAAWNQHSLSSENNLSPLQLYTAYAQGSELFNEALNPNAYAQDMDSNDDDTDSNSDDNDDESSVVGYIPLSTSSLQQLKSTINPNEQCSDFGKQLYINTVCLVYTLMQDDNLIN